MSCRSRRKRSVVVVVHAGRLVGHRRIIGLRAVGSAAVRASTTGHQGPSGACNTPYVDWHVWCGFVIERARIDERGRGVG
jgi:hypothetical protein